ncbi:MAG: DUF4870 domain-containing protein [Gammaproteobacteria bacterium]|nr:DUF4870 domain-containing protein [Xanthomonadaceae bacterium]
MEENTVKDQNNWAGGVHLAAILLALLTSLTAGVGGMIAGVIVWLIKKDESSFIRKHAAATFNFHLAMTLAMAATYLFVIVTLGIGVLVIWPVWIVLALVWFFYSVSSSINGFKGKESSYPFGIPVLS